MLIDPSGLLPFSDYFACIFQEARYGGSKYCRDKFFAEAKADAGRQFEQSCKVVEEGITCTTVCAFQKFIGANFADITFNAHKQVVLKALAKVAKETASKRAKQFIPVIGAVDFANDVYGTIKCTTKCVKN